MSIEECFDLRVQTVVLAVDAEACKSKVSKENRMVGKSLYGSIAMNRAFEVQPGTKGWRESRVGYWVTKDAKLIRQTLTLSLDEQKRQIGVVGETPIYRCDRTDFVKARALAEGKYSFIADDPFVKPLAFFVGDRIDVGIAILPMKSLQAQMGSGVVHYEGELYNVVRQGRGMPVVPLAIVGVEA